MPGTVGGGLPDEAAAEADSPTELTDAPPLVSADGRLPTVVRAVGWYLLVLSVLQVMTLSAGPGDVETSTLLLNIPLAVAELLVGVSLLRGKHWAYPAAVGLGAIMGVWYLWFLVISAISFTRNDSAMLFLPLLLMGALFLAPFALLLRADGRAWYAARG